MVLKKLNYKTRALVIFKDGNFRFGQFHTTICSEYFDGAKIEWTDDKVIGFFEVTEFRQILPIIVNDQRECEKVLSSEEFIKTFEEL